MKHSFILLLCVVLMLSGCAVGVQEESNTVIYNTYHSEKVITAPDPEPELSAPVPDPVKTEAPVPEVTCSGHGGRGCNGSSNCTICKNCKYCKHCAKEGGTCGVCR